MQHVFAVKYHRLRRRSRPSLAAAYALEIRGFEPLTYGLQSRRSSQLSYIPAQQARPCGLYLLRPAYTERSIQKKGIRRRKAGRETGWRRRLRQTPGNLAVSLPSSLRRLGCSSHSELLRNLRSKFHLSL